MAQINLGHVVGQGVPSGGTAGQILKKNGSTNFDTSWATLDGSMVPVSAGDSTTVQQSLAAVKSDMGIVEDGNTATHTIAAGQYVIWKGLLYTASSAIPSGTTLSTSNLTAVSGGGLNSLNGKFGNYALKSDIASIGTTTEGTNTTSSVSVSNNTATKISTITLTSGTYILIACVDWASGETGYRQVSTASPTNPGRRVAVTSVPAPGTNKQTYQQLIEIVSISGSESIDIYGIQTSGAALNAYPYVYAVKIK